MPENGSNKSPARARRPEQLGFGAIGGNLNVNYQQYGVGPKSAPPQIRSFEQAEASNHRGPWNESILDSRWLRNPEEMYGTSTRRTSVLTVSADTGPA